MKFTELNLDDKLQKGIAEAGFITMMPVQEKTLVHTLKGKDAYVRSQTGTGKTAAFLITIFQLFLEKKQPMEMKKALIVTPTRELAAQIEKDAKTLGRYLDFKIGCFYGGVGYNNQVRMLETGVNILVATPGRLLDFKIKKKVDFAHMGFVVIDEADRMFDMGFLPDIRKIMENVTRRPRPQMMLFSATLDANTRGLASEYMRDPVKVEIRSEQVTVDKVTQVLYHVGEQEKMNLLLGILKKELPRNALIFTNMRHDADRVARHLEHNGYKCQHITGDLAQQKRLDTIKNFKEGQLPFLVATDVAARGLHVEDLELIVNYDLPGDCENYVHRIGRTARAGKSGKAISLACDKYIYNLEAIETFIGMKIPVAYPDDDLFLENKSAGIEMDNERPRRGGRGEHGKKPRGKFLSKLKPPSRKFSAPTSHPKPKPKPTPTSPGIPSPKTEPTPKKPPKSPLPPKTESPKKTHKEHKEQGSIHHSGKKKPVHQPKAATMEERLEYYKKKYGDNFSLQKSPAAPPKKRSFLQKIAVFFKNRGKK